MQAGFGRASLAGTWQTDLRFADEVEVRTLVVAGGGRTAALSVADLALIFPSTSRQLRAATARALGIPEQNVGLFVTQNHVNPGAPRYHGEMDMVKVEQAFVHSAQEAARGLRPAEVAQVNARTDPPLVFRRRVLMGEAGEITCYYGLLLDEHGWADCSPVIRAALAGFARGQAFPINAAEFDEQGRPVPVESPLPLDIREPWPLPTAADDLIQGLYFRGLDGAPLGSVLRLATHPNAASVVGRTWHSGDYCAYARRQAEESFGGIGLFLTGPCGDQIGPIGRGSLALAERIGRRLAQATLAELPRAVWQREAEIRAASPEVRLRVRDDYPASVEAAREEYEQIKVEFAKASRAGVSVEKLKRMSDRYEFLLWTFHTGDSHRDWTGLDVVGRAGQEIAHPLFLLRIGDSVLAGMPGEPFGAYSARLRAETIGDRLITLEEANGYLSYFPTAEDYPRGGYEVTAALFGPDSEEVLIEGVKRGLAEVGG